MNRRIFIPLKRVFLKKKALQKKNLIKNGEQEKILIRFFSCIMFATIQFNGRNALKSKFHGIISDV